MDSNGDGVVQESEVPEERRGMYRMMSTRMGQDPSKGIALDKIREAMSSRGRNDQQRSAESPSEKKDDSKKKAEEEKPLVPGFGLDREPATVAGFGVRIEPGGQGVLEGDKKIDPRIRAIVRRNDRNHNGLLDKDEWGGLQGDTNKIDRNHDERITVDELVADASERQRSWRQRSGPGMGGGFDPRDNNRYQEEDKEATTPENKLRSFRFLSARERLPAGLPGWFVERDSNGDGQVAMAEYASNWTASTVSEYRRYDKNGDGVIVPEECLNRAGASAVADEGTAESPKPASGSPPGGSSGSGKATPWWLQ